MQATCALGGHDEAAQAFAVREMAYVPGDKQIQGLNRRGRHVPSAGLVSRLTRRQSRQIVQSPTILRSLMIAPKRSASRRPRSANSAGVMGATSLPSAATRSQIAVLLNISPASCGELPLPGEPNDSFPGLARA